MQFEICIVSNPWDFIPDLNEAYFLVICEWLIDHELDRSFEGCRYELFWYFLVICDEQNFIFE